MGLSFYDVTLVRCFGHFNAVIAVLARLEAHNVDKGRTVRLSIVPPQAEVI